MTAVLSLCDRTGNMVRPWAEAGHECHAVDLQHDGHTTEEVGDGVIHYVEADVTRYLPPRTDYAAAFAFPPCTDLAVSGARWFQEKGLRGLGDALQVVEACHRILQWTDAPWMLENPVSTLSTHWREPDYTFHPYEFDGYDEFSDDRYVKRTCLWTSDDFLMPPTDAAQEWDERIHRMPPSEDRADLRAETPMGFARGVYKANAEGKLLAFADGGTVDAEGRGGAE
jgi:hypothetical protein